MAAAPLVPGRVKVTVVGGGNAAQALAALLPHKGFPTSMYCPFADEAERLQAGVREQGFMLARFAAHNEPSGEVTGAPARISRSAAEVIPDADVILMPLPSFAYRPVLEGMREHLRPGQKLAATPGQGGFDWIAEEILGPELFRTLTVYAVMPMPFNCRIQTFGKEVHVQELKRRYRVGCTPASALEEVLAINSAMFGHSESCGSFLACSLYPINAVIHPARLFSLLRGWTETGEPLAENPLFYEDMTAECTALMDRVNQELIETATRLVGAGVDVAVPHIFDFLAGFVYQDPAPTLQQFFNGNAAYKGFRCPLVAAAGGGGGWAPDFGNRYFTEDIPLGLCVYRGVAELAGVETPAMDEIIAWAQAHMGKEYLKDSRLAGAHVGETSAPQRFGIATLDDLRRRYSA
mmetsp:Transcript_122119/g.380171  ORF Transcript_122119/g.380171 Transcript_122119/m.380171 type:complete len:407 (+) Transcript_122119:70-1290(+)